MATAIALLFWFSSMGNCSDKCNIAVTSDGLILTTMKSNDPEVGPILFVVKGKVKNLGKRVRQVTISSGCFTMGPKRKLEPYKRTLPQPTFGKGLRAARCTCLPDPKRIAGIDTLKPGEEKSFVLPLAYSEEIKKGLTYPIFTPNLQIICE